MSNANAEIVFEGKVVMVTQHTLTRMTADQIAQAKTDTVNAMKNTTDKVQQGCFRQGLVVLNMPVPVAVPAVEAEPAEA